MREITRTRFGWTLIIVSVLIALVLAAGGYWFFRREALALHGHQAAGLKAVADLKTGQLIRWRLERLADVRMNVTGIIRTDLLKWLKAPTDQSQATVVRERLQLFANLEGYKDMILASPDGRVLFTLNPELTHLGPATRQMIARAVATRDAVFGDFFRCPECIEVHLDVMAPILDEENRSVAVLIQRVTPHHYLYPLLQTWPTPSKSGETLLMRRDGDSVVFLNQLRNSPAPALTVRVSLSRAEVPAVQAVLGRTGSFLGRDFRGEEVLADLRAVPDSPWYLVAKMDAEEVRAEIEFVGWGILLLVVFAILMTGALAAFVFNYRQRHLYQSLFLAECQSREAQEEIRATLYGIGDGVIATDARGNITRMNPMAEQLTGWQEAEALGQPLMQVFRIVNEETRETISNPADRVLREGRIVGLANHTLLLARDGTEHPIADSGAPIRNDQGAIIGVALVFRDQTAERETRRILQENESRLNQAQKMEAVGQLAGGVAHDFNNMLMVILGHAEIALARTAETEPLAANIREILQAARRSADLTRQLLAFARKQTANPRILNLNDTVAGTLAMLQRLIGEDIALIWKPGPDLWAVKIDPTQVDQILANMSVNARDAITGGGILTIATQNVVLDATYTDAHAGFIPGQYVLLTVSDTGAGMDRATREHLFEPFFTTKEQGKGTGLGLATVYGIVKQNNGFINVYSEPGQGTTFRIYLPRVLAGWVAEPTAAEKPLARGDETILLVEDEEAILALGKDILEQCGYTVLAARLPSEALALAAQHPGPVDLLITDVVMPEMNGRDLGEKILALRPAVKILYMSGYAADVIVHHGVVEEGVNFLQKPFSIRDLATKVREVLNR